jgi:hypothetical protein
MKIPKAAQASLVSGSIIALTMGFGAACSHTHNGTIAHQHCMKIAGMTFLQFADEHGGAFPCHTNGFGDALLLLVKDSPQDIRFICGPGDDGHVFSNALAHGQDVPENQCSRVYIQGLSQTNDPGLCILFDRRSVPGGDHFYGSGERVREACMVDGFMERVPDERWAEFGRHQIELLVAAGLKREKALHYYPEAADR